MEKDNEYQIVFCRKNIEYIEHLILASFFLAGFFIDKTYLKYGWLFLMLISIVFILKYVIQPNQIIKMSEKDLCIEYGNKKQCFRWNEIIAIDFKHMPSTWESLASGGRSPSNSFRIVSSGEKSIPLKSRGWHIKSGLDSDEVKAGVLHQAKPIYDSDKIHLILALIEKRTGIKPSFDQIKS